MIRPISLVLISTLVLSSCSAARNSALNPFNWFGSSEKVEQSEEEVNPLIPQERQSILRQQDPGYLGTPVTNLASLKVERVVGGAIVRVVGVTENQGAFDVRLEPENEEQTPVKGVLTYYLMAIQPGGHRQGTPRSREISAAVFLTDQDLEGVRTIRIVSANQALQSRR